jgi:hypothetical protein
MVTEDQLRTYVAFRHGRQADPNRQAGLHVPTGGVKAVLSAAHTMVNAMVGQTDVATAVVDAAVLELGAQLWQNGGRSPDLAPIERLLRPSRGIGTVR